MTNLNILESLRTKEELVNYFEKQDQSITEKEIETLKKSYEKAEEKDGALSLNQLNSVVGGYRVIISMKELQNLDYLQLQKEDTNEIDLKLVLNDTNHTHFGTLTYFMYVDKNDTDERKLEFTFRSETGNESTCRSMCGLHRIALDRFTSLKKSLFTSGKIESVDQNWNDLFSNPSLSEEEHMELKTICNISLSVKSFWGDMLLCSDSDLTVPDWDPSNSWDFATKLTSAAITTQL